MNTASVDTKAESVQLEVRGLACTRNERRLFADLDFSLIAGEALLIDGSNGSGKTSLLRLLCGLGLADAGKICWRGRNVDDYRAEFLADIAYVGHANGIKLDLTAGENLHFAHALGATGSASAATIALAEVGLGGFEDAPCRKLSAGQRRRVALARLFVLEARLWLLDEPLTALDAGAVMRIEALLRAHLAGGGLLILTTHRPVDLGRHRAKRIRLGA